MKIIYFSILREKLGDFEEIDFEGDELKLKDHLCQKHPEVCNIIKSCRFAKENAYASFFNNADEVLAIPPVSGG
jgi:molybdopterin synthase sulfur carrier subunit